MRPIQFVCLGVVILTANAMVYRGIAEKLAHTLPEFVDDHSDLKFWVAAIVFTLAMVVGFLDD